MKLALSDLCNFNVRRVGCAGQTFYGSPDIKVFRDGRDHEFRDKKESPLKEEDFAGFTGLNYYPEDKSFIVKAKFTRTADEKYFQMPTSSGKMKMFVKYGILKFKVARQAADAGCLPDRPGHFKEVSRVRRSPLHPFQGR